LRAYHCKLHHRLQHYYLLLICFLDRCAIVPIMVKAEIAAFMAFIVTAAAVFNRSTTTNANLTIILIISTLPITTIALTMGLVT